HRFTVFAQGRRQGSDLALDVDLQRDCLEEDGYCDAQCSTSATLALTRLQPGGPMTPDGSCEALADAMGQGGVAMRIEVFNLAPEPISMSQVLGQTRIGTPRTLAPYAAGQPSGIWFEGTSGGLWELYGADGLCVRR